jgi:hypothetical protein
MPSDLFDEKTVEELSATVKVSKKQKDNASLWINLLNTGVLDEEETNYLKFKDYILQGILGYAVEDLVFEKGVEFAYKNKNGENVLCFEVKGYKVKDLFAKQHREKKEHETPVQQAWNYMGDPGFRYGVATNYDDFILLDRSIGFNSYYHFKFHEIKDKPDKLKEFIAVFSKEKLMEKNFIETIKKQSENAERDFTKEFYKLFHETRLMLIKEFTESSGNRQEAIHFAQIFLNRIMFIKFVEDTGKLKKHLLKERIDGALSAKVIINDQSTLVVDGIKNLFSQLNSGSKDPVEIFGFNGGLFLDYTPSQHSFKDLRPKNHFKELHQESKLKKTKQIDLIEASIKSRIDKGVSPLIVNIHLMISYDFTTQVTVNILGHIFEQSITDIEKLQEGEISKRKKEGVYYTPEYITDYICRNTIIPYLSEKNSTTVEELIKEYNGRPDTLEKKLKDLKVLDPACGSGAFLIKAVDVLLEIHNALIEAKQHGGKYRTVDYGRGGREKGTYLGFGKYEDEDKSREIIENNIYGVDLNEESVEITKLSLFIKIAREKRKLLNLQPLPSRVGL